MILNNQIKLTTIQYLYLVVGFLFLAAAALFYFSRKLPNTKTEATFEPAKRAKNTLILLTLIIVICFGVIFKSYTTSENAVSDAVENTRLTLLIIALLAVVGCLIYANMKASKKAEGWGAMKYPQLVLGMLAIFTYVGVEVTIQSNLGELLKSVSDKVNNLNPLGLKVMNDAEIAPFISLYWGGLMIGRWVGAIAVFNPSKGLKKWLLILVPYTALAVILLVNYGQYSYFEILLFSFCIAIQIGGFFLAKDNPIKTLKIFSLLGIVGMVIGVFAAGELALYALL